MDALVVEERLDVIGHAHVVLQALTRDVRGGDDAVACQLPHVELVDGNDSVHLPSTPHVHIQYTYVVLQSELNRKLHEIENIVHV